MPNASPAARTLAGLAGLALVVLALVATLGLALGAFAGMALAALVARRRARPYTRGAGWLGAFGGAAAVTAAVFAWALAASARVYDDPQFQAALAAQQQRRRAAPPTALERALERMAPGSTSRNPAADAQVDAMARSPAFRLWAGAMGGVIGAALVGLYAGTLGWAGATVLAYGATGRWPARAGDAELTRLAAGDPLDWGDAR